MDHQKWKLLFLGAALEDSLRGRNLGDCVCSGSPLHDAGFMPGDFFDRATEELDVVNA